VPGGAGGGPWRGMNLVKPKSSKGRKELTTVVKTDTAQEKEDESVVPRQEYSTFSEKRRM